ncbi:hypothetical protein E2562_029333 [Oryza meyeriana var. granulata]|uniref:DUF7866 domain-containing protein n=1 Tax=Oryza meyeriana var. granulata TaxID=110450 RepID=A0A6G1E4A1_9ORYZ|nr:hypothetical protein E2562_029333 [Oryza meyeriana var. granulata]
MAKNSRVSISLTGLAMAVLLFSSSLQAAHGAGGAEMKKVEYYDVPVRRLVYRPAVISTAAAYEPFELCMGCRCCASSNASSCVETRCCYAIDCNIPGKPFGVCAFSPHTCDCAATNCTNQQP